MTREPTWIPRGVVLAIHERLLAEHGGATGLIDERALDAALDSPKHHLLYAAADVFGLAAAYAEALTRNHPFRDGSKRIALTVAGVFLELNGYRLTASEGDAVAAILVLSTRELDGEQFAAWLRLSSSKIPRSRKTKSPAPKKNPRRSPPPTKL